MPPAASAPPTTNATVEIVASLDAVFLSPCAGAVGPQPAPQSLFAADHLLLATAPKMLPTTRPATPTPPTPKAIVLRSMPEPPEPTAAGAIAGLADST